MQNKLPKNCFFIEDEVYCQTFFVILTPSFNNFRKIMKTQFNKDVEDDCGCTGMVTTIHNCKLGDLIILWASDRSINLVHELLHAVSHVLRNRDIAMDSESSEEAYCYYLSYLYRKIKERIT